VPEGEDLAGKMGLILRQRARGAKRTKSIEWHVTKEKGKYRGLCRTPKDEVTNEEKRQGGKIVIIAQPNLG